MQKCSAAILMLMHAYKLVDLVRILVSATSLRDMHVAAQCAGVRAVPLGRPLSG
jgi:hypothetical protein